MDKINCFENTGKAICIITGSSRGFGRALSVAFAQYLKDGSCLVLIARNEESLVKVKESVLQQNSTLTVFTVSEDLSKVKSEEATKLLKRFSEGTKFDEAILVHNVGSLGDISHKVDDLCDFNAIQSYFDLNVSSVCTLTSAFLKVFSDLVSEENRTLLINVTSLAAIQPFSGWAQYCSGKAAREMYFKVLAQEFPNTTVLNYSPGPMETDMTTQILQSALPEIKEWFKSAKAEGKLIRCEESVEKLIHFLKDRKFHSGARVDYTDIHMDTAV